MDAATSRVSVVARDRGYGYDANGNLTNDGEFVYVWDDADRLRAVWKDGEVVMQSRYDGLGRRRERVQRVDGAMVTNRYVYDGWLVVGVLDGENNVLETYTHGPDLSGTLGGAGGIGGILSARQTGATSYYHYDGNGSVVRVSDSEGAIVSRLEYGPFGTVLLADGDFAPRFQFSSKEFDAATGLNYYGYRYYAPELGRWLNRDPIGEVGGRNIQAFVYNDPMNAVDLYGLIGAGWQPNPFDLLGIVNDIRSIYGADFDFVSRSGLRTEVLGTKPVFGPRPSVGDCCDPDGAVVTVLGNESEGVRDADRLRRHSYYHSLPFQPMVRIFELHRTRAVEHYYRWNEISYKCRSSRWELLPGRSPWREVLLRRWSEEFIFRWNTTTIPPPNVDLYPNPGVGVT